MAKSRTNFKTVALVVVLFVTFILLGIGLALYGNTLTKWWVPVMPAAVVAVVTVPVLARHWSALTESRSMIYNGACHLFAMFSLVYFLFLGSNCLLADDTTLIVEKTEVVGKYSKEHTRYRRVSRNRRVPDGHYNTYHLTLRFADGREKDREVSFNSYRNTVIGAIRQVEVEKGLWGIPVINSWGKRLDSATSVSRHEQHHPSARPKHNRRD